MSELLDAIRTGLSERVKALISQGFDVRESDRSGKQPLVIAVEAQQHLIIRAFGEFRG